MSATPCPLCGTPCRVEGKTTMHYEPIAETGKDAEMRNTPASSAQREIPTVSAHGPASDAFVRGASWAYETLTGALIVPASFEQSAREALEEK